MIDTYLSHIVNASEFSNSLEGVGGLIPSFHHFNFKDYEIKL